MRCNLIAVLCVVTLSLQCVVAAGTTKTESEPQLIDGPPANDCGVDQEALALATLFDAPFLGRINALFTHGYHTVTASPYILAGSTGATQAEGSDARFGVKAPFAAPLDKAILDQVLGCEARGAVSLELDLWTTAPDEPFGMWQLARESLIGEEMTYFSADDGDCHAFKGGTRSAFAKELDAALASDTGDAACAMQAGVYAYDTVHTFAIGVAYTHRAMPLLGAFVTSVHSLVSTVKGDATEAVVDAAFNSWLERYGPTFVGSATFGRASLQIQGSFYGRGDEGKFTLPKGEPPRDATWGKLNFDDDGVLKSAKSETSEQGDGSKSDVKATIFASTWAGKCKPFADADAEAHPFLCNNVPPGVDRAIYDADSRWCECSYGAHSCSFALFCVLLLRLCECSCDVHFMLFSALCTVPKSHDQNATLHTTAPLVQSSLEHMNVVEYQHTRWQRLFDAHAKHWDNKKYW
jgi:hypothetical protein